MAVLGTSSNSSFSKEMLNVREGGVIVSGVEGGVIRNGVGGVRIRVVLRFVAMGGVRTRSRRVFKGLWCVLML